MRMQTISELCGVSELTTMRIKPAYENSSNQQKTHRTKAMTIKARSILATASGKPAFIPSTKPPSQLPTPPLAPLTSRLATNDSDLNSTRFTTARKLNSEYCTTYQSLRPTQAHLRFKINSNRDLNVKSSNKESPSTSMLHCVVPTLDITAVMTTKHSSSKLTSRRLPIKPKIKNHPKP